jgi:hypothetical protein
MRIWLSMIALLPVLFSPAFTFGAEITDVIGAAYENNPFDLNIDVSFRYILDRAKIVREMSSEWNDVTKTDRPQTPALNYENQIFAMDYMIEIGLYHDLELYINLPWIIKDSRKISFIAGYQSEPAALYNGLFNESELEAGSSPSTERSGIGDITVGAKWAPFNGKRDDTKSTWVIGLDYIIPSGRLANPNDTVGGKTGGVGLGHHQLVPYMLFSHRFKVLDPYCGIHITFPIQGSDAKGKGFEIPYHGGFLVGMEIVPWEDATTHVSFAIDLRLTSEFFAAVQSRGSAKARGTTNELSDFLGAHSDTLPFDAGARQLQATSEYTQFGAHISFVLRLGEYVRLRFGASLAHNTEHFITGAEGSNQTNKYRVPAYDDVGYRFRVEETRIFTYWVTGMILF